MNFKIGKKNVGHGKKTFVVAELSGNHNQSLKRAKKLIKFAKLAGADAVKLQTYTADTITLKSNKKDFKIKQNSPWKKYNNFWDLYNVASTPWSWHKELFKIAKQNNIEIFSSPFDESAVDFLEDLNCPAYKIASPEINHIPLIEKVGKTKKPVIISTGLANLKDIKLALKTLKKNGCNKIAILQCVSSYPAPLSEQNLKIIPDIQKKFKVLSGLSDHTIGNTSALASVALGGSIVEKHFTIDEKIKTVDSFFSSNFQTFKDMVKKIREVELSIGKAQYDISKASKKHLKGRRSIYISKLINKGEKLSKKNVKIVRPHFGLHPKFFSKVLGKISKKKLTEGTPLKIRYLKNFNND
ncbi:MAG: pseudaminic acid synthase [Candidatus Pelagibacter sp.]|nr:pseudaminic acid synthase [Candidatus Pelagibacter sp.]